MRHSPIALALGGLWVHLMSLAQAQDMPRPSFQPGERWTYVESDLLTRQETARFTETVHSVAADGVWLHRTGAGSRAHWGRIDPASGQLRDMATATGATPQDRGRTWSTNDGGCAYPWPLKVGLRWACKEVQTFANGWRVSYDLSFEVQAAESVESAAGRFDTLRLRAQGQYLNETNSVRGDHERVIWLAPAIQRELKWEIRSRRTGSQQINRVEGKELVAYERP